MSDHSYFGLRNLRAEHIPAVVPVSMEERRKMRPKEFKGHLKYLN